MSKLVNFPSSLPQVPIPQDANATEIVSSFANRLAHLKAKDFKHDALWRDLFALTGTLRTFYSSTTISTVWAETTRSANTHSFVLDKGAPHIIRTPQGPGWIEAQFTFETDAVPRTTCIGLVSLVLEADGEWRIWTLRTLLEQLKGEPSVDFLEPAQRNGVAKLTNGHSEENHFDCIVIGGGQAGLSQGGRLKALGLSYVVLDKHEMVGDSWKTRYNSARLHTTRAYSHLAFDRTFDDTYQEWLTKDDLARGHQQWVSKYGINVWQKAIAVSGSWDQAKSLWKVKVLREGKEKTITSSSIVIAAGGGGQVPKMPEYPNREGFQGTVLHSADYKDASDWKGKQGVVIGTANTGHDVAEDMLDAGLSSVTMIQRGKTYVLPREHHKIQADMHYNSVVPTLLADRNSLTLPVAIADLLSQSMLHSLADTEPSRFDDLEKAGFRLDRYGSIINHIFNRQGGHYMDVGASAKICSGLIKMKPATPVAYTATGLKFDDGTTIEADLIIFATGFVGNMRYLTDQIFGPECAAQKGDFWGLNQEGEVKGAWTAQGHPALFYHGGTISHARYMSRFVALQILAIKRGTPFVSYERLQPASVGK